MENYLNSEGGGGVWEGVGALAGTVITSMFAKSDAKKQRQLNEALARMSNEAQIEIAEKFANAQTDIERQRIAFEVLALDKNNELVYSLQKDKYKSATILGVGALALAVVILFARKKKKNG